MPMSDDRWFESGQSPYPHEREALEFIRQSLPDHDPWKAWARLQFAADDGSENEIDLLVFGRSGFFLVEIKAWGGVIEGDQGTISSGPPARRRYDDHPMRRLKLKCDRLKSLLKSQKAFAKVDVPFIDNLVYFSHAESSKLEGPAANGVCLKDRADAGPRKGREGIIAALTQRRGANLRSPPLGKFDRPTSDLVRKALQQAGVVSRAAVRRVDDYELGETIEETTYYRDRVGRSPDYPDLPRRVRVYCVPSGSKLTPQRVQEAAEREFRVLERLDHPGILRALYSRRTDFGPAILFDHFAGSERLDHFLTRRGTQLSVDQRVDLVRQIADAVGFAHDQDLIHRALTPESILIIDADAPAPKIKVYNWQTSARLATDSDTIHAAGGFHTTADPGAYVETAGTVYLAPELRDQPSISHPVLDVFSLGALAFRVFGNAPPAGSASELVRQLKGSQGLSLPSVSNATPHSLEALVRRATHPEATHRTQSVDDFLQDLEKLEDELTRPAGVAPARVEEITKGSEIPGGLKVVRRLGAGSISIGFEVERGDIPFVLKLARSPEHNDRIRREYETLRSLDHEHIVHAVEEIEVAGSRGFLGTPKSLETLRQRLAKDGQLQLEMLERFGTQLLGALQYLEEKGVWHRDIKPENIAVSDFNKRQQGIVLFDFSLSSASAEDIQAGTPRYRDPFLDQRKRKRWDLQAERYSAAITLHEMAAGTVPQWGDGRTSPQLVEGEITIQSDLFPAEVRKGLTNFFRQALARDPGSRFADARAMCESWERALSGSHETMHAPPPVDRAVTSDEIRAAAKIAGANTPLTSLPLSTRASNCLDRLGLVTVRGLLEMPPKRILWAKGVGSKTQEELHLVLDTLRAQYPDIQIVVRARSQPQPEPAPPAGPQRLEEVLQTARAHLGRKAKTDGPLLDALLGLDSTSTKLPFELPTQLDVTRRLGVSQPKISNLLKGLREAWHEDLWIGPLRAEIGAFVKSRGGVTTVDEAAAALMGTHGSELEAPARTRTAAALVRVAVEAESANKPEWQLFRRDEKLLLALSGAHIVYAMKLGAEADALATQDPLPGHARVEEALGSVARPDDVEPPSIAQLVYLAASSAKIAAFNARQEVYPRGLSAERALRLSMSAILAPERPRDGGGRRSLTILSVRERVTARYPAAALLPDRPELDKLLAAAGLDATWSDEAAAFLVRSPDDPTLQSGSSLRTDYRQRTTPLHSEPRDRLDAKELDERIGRVLAERRLLILQVDPGYTDRASKRLVEVFPALRPIGIDRELVLAMRARAASKSVPWTTVLETDAAGPSQPGEWSRLLRLVDDALIDLHQVLLSADEPLLLIDLGLLARFDRLAPFFGRLRERLTSPPALLVLLPSTDQQPQPVLDGRPIPVTGSSQYARAPSGWLQNVDRPLTRKA